MIWFELSVGFHSDPKVVALRAILKNPLAECWVSRLYAYCYQHEVATFAGPAAAGIIEGAAGWRGRTGALVAAFLHAGFLDRSGESEAFEVHGVAKRLEKMGRHREAAAVRMRRLRGEEVREDAAPVTPSQGANVREHPARNERARDAVRDDQTRQDQTRQGSLLPAPAPQGGGEEAKPKKGTDPRFAVLRGIWEAEFLQAMRMPYRWSGPSDAKGLHRVIAVDPADFRARAQRGLRAQGFLRCGTVAKLTSGEVWNQLAGATPGARRVIGAAGDHSQDSNETWRDMLEGKL